jgi:hypothetical protein
MGRDHFRLPSPGCPRRIYSIPVNIFASYDHHHCDRDLKYLPCRTTKGQCGNYSPCAYWSERNYCQDCDASGNGLMVADRIFQKHNWCSPKLRPSGNMAEKRMYGGKGGI